ncbi:hypothetical protein FACS189460_2090 [Deltaproteobacteria bacterium]|nr:hypothetical protein FACS189460_2090 [Deltaproteobacteria bacterium]
MGLKILAVFVGGGAGTLLRWLLALKLNKPDPSSFPAGTLAANLAGGFLIGLLLAAFTARVDWPPEYRLFIITGLLGGLTTFSSFSGEVVLFLEQGRLGLGGLTLAANLLGSLSLTAAGLALGRLLFKV